MVNHTEVEPLIYHWAGCQLCSRTGNQEKDRTCAKTFLDVAAVASERLTDRLGNGLPLADWGGSVDFDRLADLHAKRHT